MSQTAHKFDPSILREYDMGEDDFVEGEYGDAALMTRVVTERVVAPEDRDPNNPQSWGKVGRNEACPCGSGKKFKHCHGAFA